jgi:hypothetical protein
MIGASITRVASLIAVLCLALAGPAMAAASQGKPGSRAGKPAKPAKVTHPMQVVIVRDSRTGCEPHCAEWVSAEGQIVPDTPAQFRRVFKVLGQKKLPIFISSNGGSVPAALAIGREIRKRGLDVAVERTMFDKCQTAPAPCDRRTLKDGDKGRPEPIGAPCISACVIILAAGTERLVPVYGFVGVHQFAAFQTRRLVHRTYQVQRKVEDSRIVETRRLIAERQVSSSTVEKDPDYAPARAYFTEMGIDTAEIMPLIMSARHQDVHRMTAEERRATRLVTRVAAGHALLPGAASGTARGPFEAAPAVPALPQALAGAGDPTFVMVKPVPAAAQDIAALSNVSASVMILRPPPQDVLELYFRLKSASGESLRPAQYTAEIQLSNGRKLTASSTGEDMIDPLYATLAREDYCALRGAGDLSLKITLKNTARPGPPRRLLFDLARVNGDADFAAKHCK